MGSFVNMLVYRTAVRYKLEKNLKSKNLNKNRSFCDFCGKQLRWYENMPVISWIIQGGKSRCCDKNLPISYPLLELGTGALFLIYGKIDLGLVVITLLLFSAVFDAKYMILPDFSTFILVILALVILIISGNNIFVFLSSALGGFLFLLVLNILTKGKGMGMGDVKYAIFMGLLLGPEKTILAFYIAFLTGAVVGIVMMIFKKAKKGSQISFGPFLILGTVMAWWLGETMINVVKIQLGW